VNHDAADTVLLALRLGMGLMLCAHSANKVFGEGGLEGTTRWFASLGLRPAWLHARLAAATEFGAGVLMASGFLLPAAGAAYIGLMVVAAFTDHKGKGFFVFKGGWEYVALVGLVAAGLVGLGPGRWSFDNAFDLDISGLGWAGAAVALGVVSAGSLLLTAKERTGS
jgi:putative oxidoreductase